MAKRKKNKGTNQGNQSAQNTQANAPEKTAKKNPWVRGADKDGLSVDTDIKTNATSVQGGTGKGLPADFGTRSARAGAGKGRGQTSGKSSGRGQVNARSSNRARTREEAQSESRANGRGRLSSAEAKRDYIFSMDDTPRIDDDSRKTPWVIFVPSILFTAIVILFVRQYSFMRDMSQFYFSSESSPPKNNNLVDFFSFYKSEIIGWSILIVGIMVAYMFISKTFAIKRSSLYIPMAGYLLFVLLSFFFSEYKDVAWNGWNDRFEGTAMILCYYAAVFFIMNTVNSERNIKFIIYPVAVVAVALSLLGLTQLTGHDFFRTVVGQKMLVPDVVTQSGSTTWQMIDDAFAKGSLYLKFTFQNNEIYQTVYNINYVSFYLTLLMPLFAMMFIWSKGIAKKLVWGAVLSLVIINFLGAKSSGGMLGMLAVIVLILIVLNKRLIVWRRSLLVILAIVIAVGAANVGIVKQFGGFSWLDEIQDTMNKTFATKEDAVPASVPATPANSAQQGTTGAVQATSPANAAVQTQTAEQLAQAPAHLDYFITKDNVLTFSLNGNVGTITFEPDYALTVHDQSGAPIAMQQDAASGKTTFMDDRFAGAYLMPAVDNAGSSFISFNLYGAERAWMFILTGENNSVLMYRNDVGKNVALENIEHFGFEKNPGFGSGRGYIWSASLPMIKDTILIGHGADTYCIFFPHNDYVGKYNADWNINMIVDKPHNMYIATAINTGLLSLIFMLALFLMYVWQSIRLYRRSRFTTFADFAGAGVFFGTSGFMVSAFVDDSSVSVMPMFYGLLGTGIAINIMLKKRMEEADETETAEKKSFKVFAKKSADDEGGVAGGSTDAATDASVGTVDGVIESVAIGSDVVSSVADGGAAKTIVSEATAMEAVAAEANADVTDNATETATDDEGDSAETADATGAGSSEGTAQVSVSKFTFDVNAVQSATADEPESSEGKETEEV